jgi:hypothetical protein
MNKELLTQELEYITFEIGNAADNEKSQVEEKHAVRMKEILEILEANDG